MKQDLVIAVVFIVYAIGMLMTFGTLLTWVERKQSAVMQDRIGANRAYEPSALAIIAFLVTWACMGLINDIPTCKELIDRIMADAEFIIRKRLTGFLDGNFTAATPRKKVA